LQEGFFSEKGSIGSSRVKIFVNWLQEELLMGHHQRENTDSKSSSDFLLVTKKKRKKFRVKGRNLLEEFFSLIWSGSGEMAHKSFRCP
jgi:hypothetical protein